MDEASKAATKYFDVPTSNGVSSYMQTAISNNHEYIVLHCGTNDLR